jgi:alpha-D-xyloside xylohydrolase
MKTAADKRWPCRLLAALALLAATGAFADVTNEVDGLLVFEAENFATNISPRDAHEWVLTNAVPGFSGLGYMQALPNDNENNNINWQVTSPELDYPLNLSNTATYYVWLRCYATNNADDSIHAGMDGQTNTASAITLVASQYGAWSWTTNRNTAGLPPPTVSGGVGPHTFQLWMREDGMSVDRVVLTTNANFNAITGNAWHIPNNPETPVGLPSMRIPLYGISANTPVTIVNGNQYQGTGNAANQSQLLTTLYYKRVTDTNWSTLPMYFLAASGNNKYFSNTIPAGTFNAGDVVQYYLGVGYTDRLPTCLYGNDALSISSELQSAAQADPYSFDVQWPLQPSAGAGYLAVDNTNASGVVEARIYTNSGHISLVGPDLAGNPLTNAITFAPPTVLVGGEQHNIGQVLSATVISNGLQLMQQLSNTNIVSQLTFTADGVMHYEVINWGSLPVNQVWLQAASDPNEHFYGFGEKFNQFDQSGKLVHMLTFDNPGDKQDSSYKVAPWFISTHGYGFHLDSSAESWFDMRSRYNDRFVVTNLVGALAFNVVYGPKLTDVLSRYTGYTGRPPTPPAWAFAPWLSSDIWQTGGQIRYAVTKYRALGIPGSVFVFDSPWEVSYNDFTWNMGQFGAGGTYEGMNYNGFNSSLDMMTFLRTNGFRVVCWLTPFINTNSIGDGVPGQNTGQSPNYSAAATNNYFVRSSPGGPPLIINWWKGTGSPVDLTEPAAQQWLAGQLSNLVAQSGGVISGFKADDGESGGSSGNTYIPTNAYYYNGSTGITMQNGWSPVYQGAIWGVLGTNGILWSRSGFTGSQAFPGCWAGDNQPNFGIDGIQGVTIAGQSAAMSGFAIWGHDICGYLDGTNIWSSSPTNLFERWAQFGALSPIMEMHRQVTMNWQYPWSFGDEGVSNYQFYARLHTALFPYLYTYAQQCSTSGLPLIRPLVLMNQADTNTYGVQQTYELGDDLLESVILTNFATTRTVYLPAGNWYDFFSQQKYAGAQNITWSNADQVQTPLFVRQGAIIPMVPTNVATLCDAAYVGNPGIATWDGTLQFLVYPATNSCFTAYDGTSLQCETAGTVTELLLSSGPRPVQLQVLASPPAGVELDGVSMTQFTNAADFAQAGQGWLYDGRFVQVKFTHPGGMAEITFGPSSAGDGISDSWRLYYFGTTATNSQTCAACDPDGDGMSNLQEYLAGTNPTNSASVLLITQLDATSQLIVWNSIAGKNYQVYSASNLASPFMPVSGTISATGPEASFTDTVPAGVRRFYRVRLVP